jgi:hypothetical protein
MVLYIKSIHVFLFLSATMIVIPLNLIHVNIFGYVFFRPGFNYFNLHGHLCLGQHIRQTPEDTGEQCLLRVLLVLASERLHRRCILGQPKCVQYVIEVLLAEDVDAASGRLLEHLRQIGAHTGNVGCLAREHGQREVVTHLQQVLGNQQIESLHLRRDGLCVELSQAAAHSGVVQRSEKPVPQVAAHFAP